MGFFVTKTKSGAFFPTYPSDHEAAAKIGIGEEVYVNQKRNIDFHRKGMGLLQLAFSNQDKYDNFDIYRYDLTIEAGFFHEGKDEKGNIKLYPKSLAFDKMDNQEFREWYEAVKSLIVKKFKISDEDIADNIEAYY